MYELLRTVKGVCFLVADVNSIADSLRFIEQRYINPIKHLQDITIAELEIEIKNNADIYLHGLYSIINKNIITLYNIYSVKNVGHLYKIDSVGSSLIDSYTCISKTVEEFDKYELILKNIVETEDEEEEQIFK